MENQLCLLQMCSVIFTVLSLVMIRCAVNSMFAHQLHVTAAAAADCCYRYCFFLVSVQRAFPQLIVTTLSVMRVFLDTLVTSVTSKFCLLAARVCSLTHEIKLLTYFFLIIICQLFYTREVDCAVSFAWYSFICLLGHSVFDAIDRATGKAPGP